MKLTQHSSYYLRTILRVGLVVSVGLLFHDISIGQTQLVLDNFGTTAQNPISRTGWTANSAGGSNWELRTTSPSSGYSWTNPTVSASGGANVFTSLSTNTNTKQLTYSNSISTVGYNTVKVRFGGLKSGTVPDITILYSTDGTSYITAGTVTLTTSWAAYSVDLPAGAEGVSNLRVRFEVVANNNVSNYLRIDDFHIIATEIKITTIQDGDWYIASTWEGGLVPGSSDKVVIAHNVYSNSAITRAASTTTTINAGKSLAVAATYEDNGTTTVNGTFQLNTSGWATGNNFVYGAAGTLTFNHSGSTYDVANTDVFWPTSNGPFNVNVLQDVVRLNSANRTVAGTFATASGVSLNSSTLTLNGTCQINSGGYFNNTPVYGASSTLVYNTGGSYGVTNEWTGNSTTAGAGVPNHVTIQNSTTLTMPNSNRGMAGNLNISSGTLALNATSGDLYIAGTWTRASGATFNPNNRAVFFNGSGTQTVSVTGGGTETFNYLLVEGSGTLKLSSSPATSVTVNASNGLTLTSSNATSTIDLNGQTFTVSGGGNLDLNAGNRYITSSAAGGVFKVTSNSLTVTDGGMLTFSATNTSLVLENGLACGTGHYITVNGTLRIDNGGYITTNSPIYGSSSLLLYNSGTNPYNRQLEWTAATGTIGTTPGYPNNVQVSSNTTFNYNNGSTADKAIKGNLTVDAGSSLYMDYGSVTCGGSMIIGGNVSIAGNLSLGFASGDDLKIYGNLSFTAGYGLTTNNRAVYFLKDGTQTISAPAALTLPYIVIGRSGGSGTTVQLSGIDLTVSAPSEGDAISFTNATDVFDINGRTLSIGTAATANTIAGSGTFKGSVSSNLTLLGTGNIGTLSFTTGSQNLGTFTINRTSSGNVNLGSALTVNTSLTLTSGFLTLGTNHLTLAAGASVAGSPSVNNMVVADGTGEFRKTFSAAGAFTFPIGDNTSTAEYSPVTLTFTGGSYSGYAGLRVVDAKHTNNQAVTNYITRYWAVSSSGLTPTSYNFEGTYLAADIEGTEGSSSAGQWNGSTWNTGSALSSNTCTYNGVTTLPATNHFSAGDGLCSTTIIDFTPTSGAPGTEVTINGTNFTGTTSVTYNSVAVTSYTVDDNNTITATIPAATAIGMIASFVVTNGCAITSAATFEVICPINITGISPTSGPVGTVVTISGSGFTGVTDVDFNSTSATFTFVNDNTITATVPTGATDGVITLTSAICDDSSSSFSVTSSSGTCGATDLFISEYVMGNSYEKYIEIYNGTGSNVDLSDYRLRTYYNGSSSPGNDVLLSGTLNNGSVIVYRHTSATLYPSATVNSACNFNGDDAVALYKISSDSNVDIFGCIGEDPGSAWTSASNTTVNKTLVRKSSVTGGVTTNPATGFPTLESEWTQYNIDDVSHLGAHIGPTISFTIDAQPTDQTECAGDPAEFSVTTTGATGYQWWEHNGTAWGSITNGGAYSGATSATLTITTALSMNGYQYYCVVDDGDCYWPTSSVQLNVSDCCSAPDDFDPLDEIAFTNITSNSMDIDWPAIATGGGADGYVVKISSTDSFSDLPNNTSLPSGDSAPWSNEEIVHTTTSTGFTISSLNQTTTYYYKVYPYNLCGTTYKFNNTGVSGSAATQTHTDPAATCADGSLVITLNILNDNADTRYQWQVYDGASWSDVTNGGSYSGATTKELTINPLLQTMNGYMYLCQVTSIDHSCETPSASFTVTVNPLPATPIIESVTQNCGSTDLTMGTPPSGVTWFWQTTADGTDTGNSALTLNVIADGTYYLRARTDAGCWSTSSASEAVTVKLVPSASLVLTPGCGSGTAEITSTITGEQTFELLDDTGAELVPPRSELITGTSHTFSGIVTGDYTAMVTYNGCSSTLTAVGTLTNTLISGEPTSADVTICGAGTATVTATLGTNSDRIEWSLDGSSVVETDMASPYEYDVLLTDGQTVPVYVRSSNGTCPSPWEQINAISTLSVTTPVFDGGLPVVHCQGAGTDTFTATNVRGTIVYSLTVNTGTGTNPIINDSTGEVTYYADFYGEITITATVTGCNITTATHDVEVVKTLTPTINY